MLSMEAHGIKICPWGQYSHKGHQEKMEKMLRFMDSGGQPYWHERGMARVVRRWGSGVIETPGKGKRIIPDNDFDFLVLVDNETHWQTYMSDMKDKCEFLQFYCNRSEEWGIWRFYIWLIGDPLKYANLMPLYKRNATHGQLHPFHIEPEGKWSRLDSVKEQKFKSSV